MTGAWTLIALDIDPSVVRPGWIPLVITVLLAGVLVLLFRSMRRQFNRISVPPSEGARGRVSRAATLPADEDDTPVQGTSTPRGSGTDRPAKP